MRILHVISGIAPVSGGPTTAICGMTEAQALGGLDVRVVSTWGCEAEVIQAERLRSRGVAVRLVGPTRGLLCTHPDLERVVDEEVAGADAVHIHALWEEVQHAAAAASRAHGVPYVFRPCGMLDPWSLRQHAIRKWVYMRWRLRNDLDHAAAIHFTSAEECEGAVPLGLRAPVIVEPLGLDLREFACAPPTGVFRTKWRDHLGDAPYVLFFGRICRKKGLDLLVPAFERAAARGEKLVIAGPDSENCRAEIEALVRARGMDDRVLFTGMLTGVDRVAALAEAEVFVLPSRQENFGVAVVEAMAAGCPVIVSDRVNIWRQIQESRGGAVVPLEGEALANELARWLADGDLRRRASVSAREFALSHYDWGRIVQGWQDHYEHLIRVNRRSRAGGESPNWASCEECEGASDSARC